MGRRHICQCSFGSILPWRTRMPLFPKGPLPDKPPSTAARVDPAWQVLEGAGNPVLWHSPAAASFLPFAASACSSAPLLFSHSAYISSLSLTALQHTCACFPSSFTAAFPYIPVCPLPLAEQKPRWLTARREYERDNDLCWSSLWKKETFPEKRKEDGLGSLEEKQGGTALTKQHSATEQAPRASNMKRFFSSRGRKARNMKYSWVPGVGSERPFLFHIHPHEETRGKEAHAQHRLWASKEGSSWNDAQITLPCCSFMLLGKRWGKGARQDLSGRATPGRISCRSKATSTTEIRSLLQHSSGHWRESTSQRWEAVGGREECWGVSFQREAQSWAKPEDEAKLLNSLLGLGRANPLPCPGSMRRPFLTNSADATVTVAPSRHLPSTPISLAITAEQTRPACASPGESVVSAASSRGRAGEEVSSKQPEPATQCRHARQLTTAFPSSASLCHFAFSPPVSFQERGPTAELIHSLALISPWSEWGTGSGEGEKPCSFLLLISHPPLRLSSPPQVYSEGQS